MWGDITPPCHRRPCDYEGIALCAKAHVNIYIYVYYYESYICVYVYIYYYERTYMYIYIYILLCRHCFVCCLCAASKVLPRQREAVANM